MTIIGTPRTYADTALWQEPGLTWPEARVLREPLTSKELKAAGGTPHMLVERRESGLVGPSGELLSYLPGEPAISLFTGAGGFDIGLEAAGFVTVCQHEWAEDACKTLIANRPRYFAHAALIQGDIRQTPTEMILAAAGLGVGQAKLLCGGPPCQGFSTVNKNRARAAVEGDQRNDMVFEYLRVVREAAPEFFIMENVPGFVSFNEGSYLRAFLDAAYGCFYELVYGLVNAVEYHVPQDRTRFLCMGTRRDLHARYGILGSLPAPECFAERDLQTLAMPGDLFGETARRLRRTPGIRYFPDREVLVPPRPVHSEGGRTQTFLDFYNRLEREEPDRLVFAPQHEEG